MTEVGKLLVPDASVMPNVVSGNTNEVSEARSDWAPDPANPLPKFDPPRRVPYGITILGRLFDDGLLGQVGLALEREFGVAGERPTGF